MDPVAIGILAGGALAKGLGAAGGQIAQGRRLFGKAQEERLKELERLEEMNALGLTSQEQSAMNRLLMDPQQALAQERLQRQQALLASSGALSSGDALNQLMMQSEQEKIAQDRAAAQIAQADMARARQQEAEIRDLQARESARDASTGAAVAAFLGAAGSSASDLYMQNRMMEEMAFRRGQDTTGIDPDLAKYLETF